MNCIAISWSDFNPEIDDMPPRLKWKEKKAWILKNLRQRKRQRFSCFEVGSNFAAAECLSTLIRQGFAEITGGEFPWSEYRLNARRTKAKRRSLIRFADGSILLEAV